MAEMLQGKKDWYFPLHCIYGISVMCIMSYLSSETIKVNCIALTC